MAGGRPRLLLYARRHVGSDDAHDVVAETFTAAWRRWSDVPEPALPWLIGTARNCIKNVRRSGRRRDALTDRIGLLEAVAADDPAESAHQRQRRWPCWRVSTNATGGRSCSSAGTA